MVTRETFDVGLSTRLSPPSRSRYHQIGTVAARDLLLVAYSRSQKVGASRRNSTFPMVLVAGTRPQAAEPKFVNVFSLSFSRMGQFVTCKRGQMQRR